MGDNGIFILFCSAKKKETQKSFSLKLSTCVIFIPSRFDIYLGHKYCSCIFMLSLLVLSCSKENHIEMSRYVFYGNLILLDQLIFKWISYSLVFRITFILLLVMTPPPKAGTSRGPSQGTADTHL